MPEAWDPTKIVSWAASVPVAVTLCEIEPRVTAAVTKSGELLEHAASKARNRGAYFQMLRRFTLPAYQSGVTIKGIDCEGLPSGLHEQFNSTR